VRVYVVGCMGIGCISDVANN